MHPLPASVMAVCQQHTLMLGLLAQIDEVKIQFSAKITSTTTSDYAQSSESAGQYSAQWGNNYWWWLFNQRSTFSASWSNSQSSKYTNVENREFSIKVNVTAVQEEMPGGMRKVLDILVRAKLLQCVVCAPLS